ncbi:Adenosine deaminase 2 [Eumeta japonica]|uniref:Adenosine deaminase n=1 Tax=Eumeta variegata TaxID=151549 RepID=A0A4C1VAX1_EUMVA|nr:Adenosine deaminase 2 [Eumeta japonica]
MSRIAIVFGLFVHCSLAYEDDYLAAHLKEKISMLQDEVSMSLGGRMRLTNAEMQANDTLMYWKHKEIDDAFIDLRSFELYKHYFQYKNGIENSNVYKIIRHMPKGAALHVHGSALMDADYFMNLTYHDDLYVCSWEGNMRFRFSYDIPDKPCPTVWQPMAEVRKASVDVAAFDRSLRSRFTLYTDEENELEADINTVWNRFEDVYGHMSQMLRCRPIRERYIYDALKKFYDENVMYLELRNGLHPLYELDGSEHDSMYTARLYQKVVDRFTQTYPDFVGVKFIYTTNRAKNVTQIRKAIETAKRLKTEMPDLFAGFDLVGQEDLGNSLTEFLPVLAAARNELDYFFHAGETNWSGTASDENLFDAVLLGAKRIGHGYALLKHPTLMEKVKRDNIAIEVNLVSNTVLSLVRDVRNHPLAAFLAQDLPVVLSSDDPGVWESDSLSHDFYVAFMGVASRRADLRMLKQLAVNSIHYSAMSGLQKIRALATFNIKWDHFINVFMKSFPKGIV